MAIEFLDLAEVLEIHRDQIERYGGAHGIRDLGLLESALAIPRSGAHGQHFHADLFEMAAAYVYHLVRNHPFVDGNKRVGAAAALVFLFLNDIELRLRDDDLVDLVVATVEGKRSKSEIAVFLEERRC